MTYDRKPTPPREPIKIAGDLVRRDDKLSKEGAVCIRDLVAERGDLATLIRRLSRTSSSPELIDQARDYLSRKGLQGSVLRESPPTVGRETGGEQGEGKT